MQFRRTRLLVVAVALSAGMMLTAGLALAGLGNNLLNISQTTTDAGYPAIDVSPDGQTIAVVWSEGHEADTFQGPVYLKGAVDGQNITVKLTVDASNSASDESKTPDVAVDPITTTDVHVVWQNRKNANTDYIYYTRCSLTTKTCGTAETVVQGVDGLIAPKVAVSSVSGGTAVYVVWQNTADGKIYYSLKRPSDSAFQSGQVLSTDTNAQQPDIAIGVNGSNKYLHFVWGVDTDKVQNSGEYTNEKLQYRRATIDSNGNLTGFTSIQDIFTAGSSTPTYASNPADPVVVAGNGMVFVLFSARNGDNTNLASECGGNTNCDDYLALYISSQDDGTTFDPTASDVGNNGSGYTSRMSDNVPSDSSYPLRTADQARYLHLTAAFVPSTTITGTLHVAWHQTVSGNFDNIYYSARPFAASGSCPGEGCQWSFPVSQTTKYSGHENHVWSVSPAIAADQSGNWYLAFMEGDGEGASGYDINYAQFDIILTSSKPEALKDNTRRVYLPIVIKNAS